MRTPTERARLLHRADGHIDNVVYFDQLFDQKRLAILHVDHVAVIPRQAIHFILKLLKAEINLALCLALFRTKLRAVGKDSFAALLIVRRDVDDKRRAEMLREDMEAAGPVRIRDVEGAQQQILAVVRQLESEGTLSLKGGGGAEYVV